MIQILQGDVLQVLPALPAESVHMVCTSPPYWGLRDYKIPPSVWGGRADCRHEWEEGSWQDARHTPGAGPKQASNAGSEGWRSEPRQSDFCLKCSAWRGALGLEPSIELYVEHMAHVMRLVRRVMRPEATAWLNLGDSYVTKPIGVSSTFDPKYPSGRDRSEGFRCNRTNHPEDLGLKSKDLCLIPFRVVLALQADGWYVRSRPPWVKHNGMPESVDDRPTNMIEDLFFLAKSEDAYYDREAGRIATAAPSGGRQRAALQNDPRYASAKFKDYHEGRTGRHQGNQPSSRARRNSDWFFASLETYSPNFQGMLLDEEGDPLAMICNPQPFSLEMCATCETCYEKRDYRQLAADLTCEACKHAWRETGPKLSRDCPACGSKKIQHVRVCACGAKTWVSHFATFPERLVTPCIALSTSEAGCCSVCGAPYVRELEKGPVKGDWNPAGKLNGSHNKAAVARMANWTKESRIDSKAAPEGSQFSQKRMEGNTSAARAAGKQAKKERMREAMNGEKPQSFWEIPSHDVPFPAPKTLGWRPSCSHPLFPASEPAPCTVLDPFGGSGRTGLAAEKMGRNSILIEVKPQYCKMIEWQREKLLNGLKPEPRGTKPTVSSPEPASSLDEVSEVEHGP